MQNNDINQEEFTRNILEEAEREARVAALKQAHQDRRKSVEVKRALTKKLEIENGEHFDVAAYKLSLRS